MWVICSQFKAFKLKLKSKHFYYDQNDNRKKGQFPFHSQKLKVANLP